MKGVFVNWTKPYQERARLRGHAFKMQREQKSEEYITTDEELLFTILSVGYWKEFNGKTKLFTDRDGLKYKSESTVFFTAYIVGKGTNVAAYEIKGCYLQGTTTISGYVTNTYVDTNNFTEPTISFNSDGDITVTVTGVGTDVINWTAVIDFVSICWSKSSKLPTKICKPGILVIAKSTIN